MKTLRNTLKILVAATVAASAGCAPPDDESLEGLQESEAAGLTSANGLGSINGLSSVNGLGSINGLNSANGLSSVNGLSSTNGLMTTSAGRATVAYLVRCALPVGRSITKQDQAGNSYTYSGLLGFAPEWETASCGQVCQEYVSACIMAHVNTAGNNVPLWVNAYKTGIGFQTSATYPKQEGSFFGNIFVSPPKAYYCNGKDFAENIVPGRIGATQTGAPYTNLYVAPQSTFCADNCTKADYPYAANGYKACSGFNRVVTVYRQ